MGFLNMFKKRADQHSDESGSYPGLDLPPPPLYLPELRSTDESPFEELKNLKAPVLPTFQPLINIPRVEREEEYAMPTEPETTNTEETDIPAPLFVSVEDYRAVLGNAKDIKAKLSMTESRITRIAELHHEQDLILESYRKTLEETERKLAYVEETIAQGKR